MKKILVLIIVLLTTNLTYALNIEGNSIIDSKGNRIVKKEYKRIILIAPSAVEIFYMIDAEKNIIAIGNTVRNPIWPKEKTEKLNTVGTITKPSIEQVIKYRPDLVILNSMATSFGESLKSQNIPFLVTETKSLDEILQNVKIYGVIVGKSENADKLEKTYRLKLEKIKQNIKKTPLNIKGAFLFSTSPMMVFNETSLPGKIFKILGIKNIADNLPGDRPIVSPEFLLSENPDILLGAMSIKNKEDIINSNPVIKQTKAGKTGNVMIIPSDKVLRGTPRLIDALEGLYQELLDVK